MPVDVSGVFFLSLSGGFQNILQKLGEENHPRDKLKKLASTDFFSQDADTNKRSYSPWHG